MTDFEKTIQMLKQESKMLGDEIAAMDQQNSDIETYHYHHESYICEDSDFQQPVIASEDVNYDYKVANNDDFDYEVDVDADFDYEVADNDDFDYEVDADADFDY